VFCKKHRRLALVTVALLLSFTLMDLTGDVFGAPVCAADADTNEENQPSATPHQSPNGPSPNEQRSSKPEHIDDCFCCSGCVESSPRFKLDSGLWTVQPMSPDQFRHRSLPPAEFYRPPKAS
jgi:hypothetical protein